MTQPSSGVERGDSGNEQHEQHEEHESHGHSTAAWTGVGIILVGSVIMALAVVFAAVLWFVIGAIVVVVGIIGGCLLYTSDAADE